ncbi:MDR family NADP-dependent oxidoreductase [Streptomyces sp. NBC_01185]|uniref:MDR family NADP-dependent oxidoreductase n=1 Tax=Streptomyces sp. NBC_01185 TaxID=2903764 RepID=UPI00386E49C2|nr:NADP-dependent oxidoreductase [Streptomyces sp. NBC_01185]
MTARPALPRTSREVRLAALPEGLPRPEHFDVVETPLPRPGAGEVLVRNAYFQVFPALRTLVSGGVEGAPFPGIVPGEPLFGPAVGEVVARPGPAGPPVGAWVSHFLGWREYAVVPAEGCTTLDDGALPDPAAHLSLGSLAYTALTRIAGLRPGETVFVSGGAGATGSMAGQIARLLGAGRVIGSTGSPAKAERMTDGLGYDAVVARGPEGSFSARLAEAAPEGIDVFVDMVGGEQLQAAVRAARPGARFVLVGTLAGQLSGPGGGATAPVEIDTFQLVVKRITMRGISGLDHPETHAEWTRRFGGWLRSGEITFPHVRIAGMDNAPRALHELMAGRHLGTVVVET